VRRILGPALVILAAGCAKKVQAPTVQTAMVTRRDVIVDAQANGVIEPLVIVDVKSKAGGVITQMPVETGTHVSPGDLIVQIDTRDVQNRYNQAAAALAAAQQKLTLAESDKKRNDELFKARVITAQEHDNVAVSYETANSNLVSAKANLDLAKQALDEATVRAPQEGTIITKNVAVGTVIASATGSVSGGTTIVQMADLSTVRVRALFNETDIGNVRPGEPANVTVDAYPDRRFGGVVEKIEPQAVIQQNVTMFPVLVNLQNGEGLLRPGMNGQVAVLIDERDNVLAIPNDAIKNVREAVATGAMLGLSADSVNKELAAQGFTGGRGGFQRGGGGGNGGRRNGGATGSANGDLALMDVSAPQGQGGFGQGGGFGMQVSDADCKKIVDAEKAHPAEKKQIDELRTKLRALMPAGFTGGSRNGADGGGGGFPRQRAAGDSSRRRSGGDQNGGGANGGGANGGGQRGGNPEMRAINDQLRALYEKIGVDARTANACARRSQNGGAQNAGGQRQASGAQSGTALTPSTNEGANRPVRQRQGLVFVSDSSKTQFHPRIVMLGQGNLDFTEVVSGLKEGDRVVMLGALALQAQRQQQQDRFRAGAANPLGGGGPGRGGRGG
jgi:HlyD family secretion protein